MTFNSGNPPAMTPEQKLASKHWRRVNSWWIFAPILSCGLLGWLGFMTAAIRTGKRDYWIYTGIYAGLTALFFVLVSVTDPDGVWSDLATIPFLGAWVAPTIHAAILNRRYLRELATQGEWYATPFPAPDAHTHQPQPPVLGVSHNDYYGPAASASTSGPTPPASAGPPHTPEPPRPAEATRPTTEAASQNDTVNVNTVGHADLSALPGVGDSLARRIIAIRDARGGYRSVDDLAAAANLQPHELVRIRDKVTFDQPSTGHQQRPDYGGSGRILDI